MQPGNMSSAAEIGARIREARLAKKMSQSELAEKSNISLPHISEIELGKADIRLQSFIRIIEALQVSSDEIIKARVPAVYDHNPIRTSYELLWDDIKNPNRVSPEGILNTMRRILEHYFQVIGGIDYEKCISEFDGEEKVICKSLVAYINDGSHSIFDDIMLSLDDSWESGY